MQGLDELKILVKRCLLSYMKWSKWSILASELGTIWVFFEADAQFLMLVLNRGSMDSSPEVLAFDNLKVQLHSSFSSCEVALCRQEVMLRLMGLLTQE